MERFSWRIINFYLTPHPSLLQPCSFPSHFLNMMISFSPKDFCTYLHIPGMHTASNYTYGWLSTSRLPSQMGFPSRSSLANLFKLLPPLILYLNSQSVYLVTPFVITYLSACVCVSLANLSTKRKHNFSLTLKSPSPKPIHRMHTISVYWINEYKNSYVAEYGNKTRKFLHM